MINQYILYMKNFRKFIFTSVFLLSSFCCFAYSRLNQDLILCDSPIYKAFKAIQVESARVTFYDQGPITISQLKAFMNLIDYDKLSTVGKKQYDCIQNYINEKN